MAMCDDCPNHINLEDRMCKVEENIRILYDRTNQSNIDYAILNANMVTVKDGLLDLKNELKESFKNLMLEIDKTREQPQKRYNNVVAGVSVVIAIGAIVVTLIK